MGNHDLIMNHPYSSNWEKFNPEECFNTRTFVYLFSIILSDKLSKYESIFFLVEKTQNFSSVSHHKCSFNQNQKHFGSNQKRIQLIISEPGLQDEISYG